MVRATEHRPGRDRLAPGSTVGRGGGRGLLEALVQAQVVEVGDILTTHAQQIAFADDDRGLGSG